MPPRRPAAQDAAPPPRDGPAFRHAFLQAVMARAYLRESEAKELYKRICSSPDGGCRSGVSPDGTPPIASLRPAWRREAHLCC